jgi:hypothetical protein
MRPSSEGMSNEMSCFAMTNFLWDDLSRRF